MLSLFISIPIAALALWLLGNTTRRMWRLRASRAWWAGLIIIVLAGGYAGFRLGYHEIQASVTLRWVGLPLPIGFFALEGERWTDFIPPPPVQWMNFIADILIPILVLLIPLAIVWRRREQSSNTAGSTASSSTPPDLPPTAGRGE